MTGLCLFMTAFKSMLLYTCMLTAWQVYVYLWLPLSLCWFVCYNISSTLAWSVSMSVGENQEFLQWSVSDKPAFLQWSVGDKPDLPAVVCWWQTSLPTVGLLVTNQPSYSGLLVTNQAFLQWSVGDKPVIPAVDNLNLINCIICISITCRTSIFNHMTTDLLCPLNIMTVSKNIAKLSQGFWRLSWRYYWHCFSIVYLVNIRPWYFASSNSLIDIERSKYIFLIIFLHYNYQE